VDVHIKEESKNFPNHPELFNMKSFEQSYLGLTFESGRGVKSSLNQLKADFATKGLSAYDIALVITRIHLGIFLNIQNREWLSHTLTIVYPFEPDAEHLDNLFPNVTRRSTFFAQLTSWYALSISFVSDAYGLW
jgi:hypothetical protein